MDLLIGLGGFIIFVGLIVLLVWAINPGLFKSKEKGETCEKDDKDVRGTYEYDEDGKCVLKSCFTGWEVNGDVCVKKQVSTSPSVDASTSQDGRCGPVHGNTKCPGTQCCSNSGWCGGVIGVQSDWCSKQMNNTWVGDLSDFDGIPTTPAATTPGATTPAATTPGTTGSGTYSSGATTPGTTGSGSYSTPAATTPAATTPGTTGSGSYSTPAATTPPPPAGVEGFMDCAYGNPDSNYVCIAGASRAENCTWDDNECSGYYSDTCPPGVTLNDRGYCQV